MWLTALFMHHRPCTQAVINKIVTMSWAISTSVISVLSTALAAHRNLSTTFMYLHGSYHWSDTHRLKHADIIQFYCAINPTKAALTLLCSLHLLLNGHTCLSGVNSSICTSSSSLLSTVSLSILQRSHSWWFNQCTAAVLQCVWLMSTTPTGCETCKPATKKVGLA